MHVFEFGGGKSWNNQESHLECLRSQISLGLVNRHDLDHIPSHSDVSLREPLILEKRNGSGYGVLVRLLSGLTTRGPKGHIGLDRRDSDDSTSKVCTS